MYTKTVDSVFRALRLVVPTPDSICYSPLDIALDFVRAFFRRFGAGYISTRLVCARMIIHLGDGE